MLLILLMEEAVVFLLNNIKDLAVLIACPDSLQYESRQSLMVEASEEVALAKMRRSSINKRCVIGGLVRAIFIHLTRPRDDCL